MHGDMNQSQRERALKRFEHGTVKTLVATDVAARGLDLDDITHVINFDPPEEHTALHPPRRPHRPRGRRRHRRHARPPRAAGRGQPRRADARAHRAVQERGDDGRAAAARLRRRSAATPSGARPGPAARSSSALGFTARATPNGARGVPHRRIDSRRGRRGPFRASPIRRSPPKASSGSGGSRSTRPS